MFDLNQDRELLKEIFRPEDGFCIEGIIGTTFSLDLAWLLQLVTYCCGLELSEQDILGEQSKSKIVKAIREILPKLAVFVEQGRISARKYRKMHELLKNSIVQVKVKKDNSFHPKMWLIKYSLKDQGKKNYKYKYKLIVMSRNGTWSKYQESFALLESKIIADKKNKRIKINSNIASFIDTLKTLTDKKQYNVISDKLNRMTKHLDMAIFGAEDRESGIGYEGFFYQQMGNKGDKINNLICKDCKRILVFSPFIGQDMLEKIAGNTKELILVSGENEICKKIKNAFYNTINHKMRLYYIRPKPLNIQDDEGNLGAQDEDELQSGELHAKMIFMEKSVHDVRLLLGSANLTKRGMEGDNFESVAQFKIKQKDFDDLWKYIVEGKCIKEGCEYLRYFEQLEKWDEISEDKKKQNAENILKQILNLDWHGSIRNRELILPYPEDEIFRINKDNLKIYLMYENKPLEVRQDEYYIKFGEREEYHGSFFRFIYKGIERCLSISIDYGEINWENEVLKNIMEDTDWEQWLTDYMCFNKAYTKKGIEGGKKSPGRGTDKPDKSINKKSGIVIENILRLGYLYHTDQKTKENIDMIINNIKKPKEDNELSQAINYLAQIQGAKPKWD